MKIKTTDWDAVAASAPLNKEASVVRDGSGAAFVTKSERVRNDILENPLPVIIPPHQFKDFTGRTFGRYRIVGFVDLKKANVGKTSQAKWLARCACGLYQTLKHTTLVKYDAGAAMLQNDRCFRCMSQARIFKGKGNTTVRNELAEARSAPTEGA